MSLFIVFEGGDGAGKHTQAQALYRRLRWRGYPAILTEEPGGTLWGRMLRRWLTAPQVASPPDKEAQLLLTEKATGDEALPDIILFSIAPRAEFLLFLLSRAQLVDDVIYPSLEKRKIVICSRYAPSSVAYQGYGRGLDISLIEEANKIATRGLRPDLIFLLDMPPEEGLRRKYSAGKRGPYGEKEIVFQGRVREGYRKMAADDPQTWVIIDGTQPMPRIRDLIWRRVQPFLVSRFNL